MAVNKNLDSQHYKQTLESVFPTQFEVGSLADRLLIQGREEGQKIGQEIGREIGREEGVLRGKLAGTIQTMQQILQVTVSTDSELLSADIAVLHGLVADLQQRVRDRQA